MAAVLDDIERWAAIRPDYEAGILSLREIAKAHSTPEWKRSHTAIEKYANANGWMRSLKARIQQRADAKVQRQIAREHDTRLSVATERQVIEANATRIAQVRGEHRHDINRARKLALSILERLELIGGEGATERLRAALAQDHDKAKAQALEQLESEEPLLRGALNSLRMVIQIEREAYGMDDLPPSAIDPSDDTKPLDRREIARQVAFMLTREAIERARQTEPAAHAK